ncbi:MAG: pyrroline-5-carboxylate reductase [Pseudomonadota bacterium]
MQGTSPEAVGVRSLVLLGCGKMGGALLEGWLASGLPAETIHVIEPHPSEALTTTGVRLNQGLPDAASVAILAVKPQIIEEAAPELAPLAASGTVFISIAAGTPIAAFETMFGAETPIIRVMPNTPSAIGQGISAIIGNAATTEAHLVMAEQLMAAVGSTVRLETEAHMDVVTGLSGSGPAYVFHLIEAMAAAGEAEGLPPKLAMALARATVSGAGALAAASTEPADVLRQNVTSPGGTTAAGLGVLMQDLPDLIRRTVAAAAERSRELAG